MRSQISHAKNHGITPDEMRADADQARDEERQQTSEVFRAYNTILRKAAALDFDDLLLRSVELLREHADVRAAWSAASNISWSTSFRTPTPRRKSSSACWPARARTSASSATKTSRFTAGAARAPAI